MYPILANNWGTSRVDGFDVPWLVAWLVNATNAFREADESRLEYAAIPNRPLKLYC